MKENLVGKRLAMGETVLEIVRHNGCRVAVRYVAPAQSEPINDWYTLSMLYAAGWHLVTTNDKDDTRSVAE